MYARKKKEKRVFLFFFLSPQSLGLEPHSQPCGIQGLNLHTTGRLYSIFLKAPPNIEENIKRKTFHMLLMGAFDIILSTDKDIIGFNSTIPFLIVALDKLRHVYKKVL